MADELFLNSLGNDFTDPSAFEFTSGNGYADNWNHDAGKAISNAVNGWFFGSVTHEYGGQVIISLTPSTGATTTETPTVILATDGFAFGGAGVFVSTIPVDTVIPEIDPTTGLPLESLTGFVFGGGAAYNEPEAVSTIPQVDEIVTEGGFQFCGPGISGDAATSYPSLEGLEAEGGFKLAGAGVWGQIKASDIPVAVLVGSGGFILAGTGLLPDTTPTTTVIVSTGGFKLGGLRPDPFEVIYPGDADETIDEVASFEMGGEGIWEQSVPGTTIIVSSGAIFEIAGAGIVATQSPPLVVITGDGGFTIGGNGWPTAVGADTVVLTGNEFGPSLYSNFNFTSYAQYRGQYYGAKDDGIYLLGGPDDAGDPIHPGVRIGPTNFGTANYKRLRSVNVGENSNGAKVGVRAGERRTVCPVKQGKAFIPRNLQSREMVIDIIDFEQISHIELVALIIAWD